MCGFYTLSLSLDVCARSMALRVVVWWVAVLPAMIAACFALVDIMCVLWQDRLSGLISSISLCRVAYGACVRCIVHFIALHGVAALYAVPRCWFQMAELDFRLIGGHLFFSFALHSDWCGLGGLVHVFGGTKHHEAGTTPLVDRVDVLPRIFLEMLPLMSFD